MTEESPHDDITKKTVVYHIPGMDAVTIRRDTQYRVTDAGALTMDIYYPPDSEIGERLPAVAFVSGFSDVGFQARLGCRLKEMGSYTSWGRLAAASGLAAITYETRE